MYTRKGFEKLRLKSAQIMANDRRLQQDVLKVLVKADRHMWIHQTIWLGEPILQIPQDMFALQEIIYKTRPDFIIETGVAWGGSLLFYSSLMEILGGKKVIGIDIYIPDDLRKRLARHGKISKRILIIKGSSVEDAVIQKVKKVVGNSKRVLVSLDSFHTHEHVLKELRIYAPFVGKGFYLVCGDTIVEDIPPQKHRPRPWGHGNNPKTAVRQFLKENNRFRVDKKIENKLLFTCNPNGYLMCCRS